MTNKIAQVIPAIKLPRGVSQIWDYRVPEKLQSNIRIGDTVRIPFRKKELLGIVASFSASNETDFKLKDILSIVPELSLSEKQLEMARFISDYYFVPLDMVIKLMFPPEAKRTARTAISLNPVPEIGIIAKKTVSDLHEKMKGRNRLLLLHSLGSERHEIYLSLVKKTAKGSQSLLMMPESFDIYSVAKFYIDRIGEKKVAILSSDITQNQYLAEWQKIRSGAAELIIGTRQTIFAPFTDLKLVIADEEHNSSYKQWDQNPRYHGIRAAIELADIHDTKIVLSSPTPSLESYYRTKDKFSLLDISRKPNKLPEIIDMENEKRGGNHTFISERLEKLLLENIYAKKQALIFIPRLGEKTIHQCRDCGCIAECPACQNPLISYRNKLYCPRCKTEYEPLRQCPACKGQNIGAFGGGSERVFAEISKLFENKNIRIAELDSVTSKERQNKKVFAAWQKGRIDILIGTQMAWKNYAMKNLAIIAVIFPEIIFSAPGFRSREKSRQFLERIYRLAENKTIIIQSRKPKHRYFEEMRSKSVIEFFEEEISLRAAGISPFPYPPLGKLIKLLYKHPDQNACMREAKWQYEKLKKEIQDRHLENDFEVIPPFPAQSFREYGKYRYHIVIRHKNGLDNQVRDILLRCVDSDWIIDIDPDEIL